MEKYVQFLKQKGADQCWHKDSTFLSHLVEVGKILENWRVPQDIVLLGIFHSFFGNKWISTDILCERKELEGLIGPEAEKLVFQFCHLDRMKFMFQLVLKELAKESPIPEIIDFEGEKLTKRQVAIFIITTLSDWLSQWNHFQDDLFQIEKRHALGKDLASFFEEFMQDKDNITLQNAASIWPQSHVPGLVLHILSQLNQVLIKCEEKDLQCPILPHILSLGDEKKARDLYCQCRQSPSLETIVSALHHNPYVGEIHNLHAQICLAEKKFEEAEQAARKALDLLQKWGTPWDKTVAYQAWITHTQLLIKHATKKEWPQTAMGIINLM